MGNINLQGLIDEVLGMARARQTPGRFQGGTWSSGEELDADRRKKEREDLLRLQGSNETDKQRLANAGQVDVQGLKNTGGLEVQKLQNIGSLDVQKENSAGALARQGLENEARNYDTLTKANTDISLGNLGARVKTYEQESENYRMMTGINQKADPMAMAISGLTKSGDFSPENLKGFDTFTSRFAPKRQQSPTPQQQDTAQKSTIPTVGDVTSHYISDGTPGQAASPQEPKLPRKKKDVPLTGDTSQVFGARYRPGVGEQKEVYASPSLLREREETARKNRRLLGGGQ